MLYTRAIQHESRSAMASWLTSRTMVSPSRQITMSASFSLFSIRERLDHVSGQLKIKSKPGYGTQVTLVAPLRRDDTTTREERHEHENSPWVVPWRGSVMRETLRILVVDDDRRMTKTLANIFRVKGYEAVVAHSGSEALEKVMEGPLDYAQNKPFDYAQNGPLDCVLTDIRMPDLDGVELYRAIKARRPDLPVVLMTAYSADRLVEEGLEEGAIAALTKPLDINALLCFFSSLRWEQSVVVVDDDTRFCETLADILRQRSFAVTPVTDPYGVVERLKAKGQVVLLDMKLDGVGSLEVLKQIREQYPCLPVILMTGYREEMAQEIAVALKLGAYACLYKPFQIEELLQLLTKIRRQELRRVLGC